MTAAVQHFPRLTIEALPSGLIRFEDDSCLDGPQVIDAHPAQIQIAASMLGFNVPDKTRAALARLARRLRGLHEQVLDLECKLQYAVKDQDLDMCPEMIASEFIAHNMGELLQDLEAIQAPDLEPMADAPTNHGEQLTIPL